MHKKILSTSLLLTVAVLSLNLPSSWAMYESPSDCPLNPSHRFPQLIGDTSYCFETPNTNYLTKCDGYRIRKQSKIAAREYERKEGENTLLEFEKRCIQKPTTQNGHHTICISGNRYHHIIKSKIKTTSQGADLGNGLTEAEIIKNGIPQKLYGKIEYYEYNGQIYSFTTDPDWSSNEGAGVMSHVGGHTNPRSSNDGQWPNTDGSSRYHSDYYWAR